MDLNSLSSPALKPGGMVYFVGAGPGSLDYLTVRGHALLQQAEVVFYDALVAPELLAVCPAPCECLCVGKRSQGPSLSQAQINQYLVDRCRRGQRVVRLKGGDGGIFGRLRDELAALTAAGCAYEVIPGVSAALAAPLLAGLCLTDKHQSRVVAICTAHDLEALDWSALARLDTLILLMATQNLGAILGRLQALGRPDHEAIALIRWAGHPQQQTWFGTLATIQGQLAGYDLAPAVIVIGPAAKPPFPARLENVPPSPRPDSMTVAMSHPLRGQTILVTRAASQASAFTQQLQRVGATVLEMPTLEIGPPQDWQTMDRALQNLDGFDWLILTSHNGVHFFFQRLEELGLDSRALGKIKIAVVGEKTAQTLSHHGLRPDFVPPAFIADALIDHFPVPVAGLSILFPRVETGGRPVLGEAFRAAGAQVLEVAAYQSRCPAQVDGAILQALEQHQIDMVTFTSSKTVHHFCQLLGGSDRAQELLNHVKIASIGPQTSQTCQTLLGKVDIEAQEHSLEGLLIALCQG